MDELLKAMRAPGKIEEAFNRLLGVKVLHRSPERTEAELTVREELCNRRGVLHGGAVMALGDTLGGMTASISLPEGGVAANAELRERTRELCDRLALRLKLVPIELCTDNAAMIASAALHTKAIPYPDYLDFDAFTQSPAVRAA